MFRRWQRGKGKEGQEKEEEVEVVTQFSQQRGGDSAHAFRQEHLSYLQSAR